MFIHDIQVTQYGQGPETEIPDNLQADSWIDGAQGQIELITDEDNFKKEEELKITSNQHFLARTGVGQSANLGPNFKLVKKDLEIKEVSHQSTIALSCFSRIS